MARAYALKGDSATAIEWLNKGVDLWPEDFSARLDLAEALFNNGEFHLALRHLEEAQLYNKTMEKRQRAQIHFYRGFIFYRGLDEPGKALFNFEKAVELDPALPQATEIRRTILELRAHGYQPLPDEGSELPQAPGGRSSSSPSAPGPGPTVRGFNEAISRST